MGCSEPKKKKEGSARTAGQVIVYRVVLHRQIHEEEFSEVRNAELLILEALGHLAELALDLDHAVQDEVREHRQHVLLHDEVHVREAPV